MTDKKQIQQTIGMITNSILSDPARAEWLIALLRDTADTLEHHYLLDSLEEKESYVSIR